eukprot:SAG11_NODE_5371_length_1580_cov_3.199865_1_plen_193_part_00
MRYRVIRGSNVARFSAGIAARMRSRYATAISVVVTGGLRLGMMIAAKNGATDAWCQPRTETPTRKASADNRMARRLPRPVHAAESGATAASIAPSRKCRCMSSGSTIVSCSAIVGGDGEHNRHSAIVDGDGEHTPASLDCCSRRATGGDIYFCASCTLFYKIPWYFYKTKFSTRHPIAKFSICVSISYTSHD